MLSFGMLCPRAAWIALRRRGLPLGSPPPVLAAMVISLDNLLKILPRFASIAPLKRLTFDHLLCPAIDARSYILDYKFCLTINSKLGTAHLAREWPARNQVNWSRFNRTQPDLSIRLKRLSRAGSRMVRVNIHIDTGSLSYPKSPQ